MDSWHAGTGATDNGAGVVVAMEAVRILKALNVHPKRTIRIALWSGEEQGLLGSRAYVAQHFGSRPQPQGGDSDLPSFLRPEAGPVAHSSTLTAPSTASPTAAEISAANSPKAAGQRDPGSSGPTPVVRGAGASSECGAGCGAGTRAGSQYLVH